MIEAYKVGVSLILDSNVTRETGNIARQFEQLDKIIKGAQRSINELVASMREISRVGQAAADSWTVAAQAMERAARAATRAGQAMPGAPGGGGGSGGSGGFLPPGGSGMMVLPLPGPRSGGGAITATGSGALVPTGGGRGGGMPPFVFPGGGSGGGGGAVGQGTPSMGSWVEWIADFLAVRQSMREDVNIRSALMSMGFKAGGDDFNPAIKTLRSMSAGSAVGTIFSEAQAASGMPAAAAVLGFGGSDPASRADAMKKFSAIYPTILRLGEVAEMQHMGGMQESMVAAIGYAHVTDRYDPKQLEPGLDRLMNVARLTHSTIPGELRALQYSVPVAKAAGMNPDDAATLTGFLQVLGFRGTTAGTSFGQIITGIAPVSLTKHGLSDKGKALRDLGVLNDNGQLNEQVAPGGKVDAMALLNDIASYAKGHKPTEVLETLRKAFTVRGMRAAGVLEGEDSIPRLMKYIEQINNLPGARETQATLAQSPMQGFEQMAARFADVGNTLATGTLPALDVAFRGTTAALEAVNGVFKGDDPASAMTGSGLGLLALSSMLRWGASGMRKFLPTGGGAIAGPMLWAGNAARAAGGLALIPGLAMLGGDAVQAGGDWISKHLLNFDRAADREKTREGAEREAHIIADAIKAALANIGINMDGKRVGAIVAGHMADQNGRPPTGSSAPDLRISPLYPSMAIPFP